MNLELYNLEAAWFTVFGESEKSRENLNKILDAVRKYRDDPQYIPDSALENGDFGWRAIRITIDELSVEMKDAISYKVYLIAQKYSSTKEVLVVVLNSKRLSRGVYDLKGLTFGEVEDLMAEESEDVQFYIENDEEILEETHAGSYVDQFDDPVRFVEIENERKKKEREWTEHLISKREGF